VNDPALVAGEYDPRDFTVDPKTKLILVGNRRARVRQDVERRLVLPNGQTVRVSVDASGHATQIEENDRLHAVARPSTIRFQLRKGPQ
jgi:hypothetical protein